MKNSNYKPNCKYFKTLENAEKWREKNDKRIIGYDGFFYGYEKSDTQLKLEL